MEVIGGNKVKVLDLINRFGVIANKQIFKYFKGEITNHAIYKILSELADMGVISKSNIGRLYYAYIRPSATAMVTEPMYRFNSLNQTELLHDLRVNDYLIDSYLKTLSAKKYENVSFFTERELVNEELIEKEDKLTDSNYTRQIDKLKRHLPDGILLFSNADNTFAKIAIEYEQTQKSKKLYEQILKNYDIQYHSGDLNRVIYVVKSKRIQRKIEQVMTEQDYHFSIRFEDADEVFE